MRAKTNIAKTTDKSSVKGPKTYQPILTPGSKSVNSTNRPGNSAASGRPPKHSG